jgi:hypothetical protein
MFGPARAAPEDEERSGMARTKDEINSAPEFDPDTHRDDSEYRGRVGNYYARD